jgi:peptide chain release factor
MRGKNEREVWGWRRGKSCGELKGKAEPMDLPPEIQERLDALGVLAADVRESFVRGSGAGGQKINKTSSTVVLRHEPSGLEVRCQAERSQARNRELAWAGLCEKFEALVRERRLEQQARAAKQRAAKRGRSTRQKARLVTEKRIRAKVKAGRRGPAED